MTNLKELEEEKKVICLEMAKAKKAQKDLEIYLRMIQDVERDIEQAQKAS